MKEIPDIIINCEDYNIEVNIFLPANYKQFLNNLKEKIQLSEDDEKVIFSIKEIIEEYENFASMSMMLDDKMYNFIPIGFYNYDYVAINLTNGKIYDSFHELSYNQWDVLYDSFEEYLDFLKIKTN